MFGRSKPVVLQPYGHRRQRGRPPRWLVLLLIGAASGAAGVVYVQERHLPPRLSQGESTRLRSAFDSADAERQRLQRELAQASTQLSSSLTEKKALQAELLSSKAQTDRLREDLGAVVAALPPDPRGGSVEVRAGRISAKAGVLSYDVVLTREHASKALPALVQLTVTGTPARGPETSVALKPVSVAIGAHEVVRGSAPLPEGFKARETTIQVLDRSGAHALGRRVMLVK